MMVEIAPARLEQFIEDTRNDELRTVRGHIEHGWETAKILEDGEWLRATTYVGASVIAGLLLSIAGIRLANRF